MLQLNEIIFAVFVYNIIFGSGVLLMPKAFWAVGYGLGTFLLVLLAFISWTSCVFVIESLSLANVVRKLKNNENQATTTLLTNEPRNETQSEIPNEPNLLTKDPSNEIINDKADEDLFKIDTKYEVAEMANCFFGKKMLIIFYTFMIVYLYGDLCIYLSVVGSTLQRLSCPSNSTKVSAIMPLCIKIGGDNIFRICVAFFFTVTTPFVFLNLKKSIFIQLITMVLRLLAVVVMVTFASIRISRGDENDIVAAKFSGIPYFFGVTLYGFMCQHSLPSMVNCVTNKNAKFTFWILASMCLALIFYLITAVTATLSFKGDELFNIYSMNFDREGDTVIYQIFYYFLMTFPTFALLASYPIVATTLRENLISLTNILFHVDVSTVLRTWVFPIFAILPPFIMVMSLPGKVDMFAQYIGTYAGSFVQYFIPACLVLYARKTIRNKHSNVNLDTNVHTVKMLNNQIAPWTVIIWAFIGIGIVTYYNIVK